MSLLYDALMFPLELLYLRRLRSELLGPLSGSVFELGAGTGANFPHYSDPQRVVATEPDPKMRARAYTRRPHGLMILDCPGERISARDQSFDHAVCTLVLCSVKDLSNCLQELYRIVKPGGSLHFIEHVRRSRLHDLVTPMWSRLFSGCCLDRRTLEAMKHSGWKIAHCSEAFRVLGVPFLVGRATR